MHFVAFAMLHRLLLCLIAILLRCIAILSCTTCIVAVLHRGIAVRHRLVAVLHRRFAACYRFSAVSFASLRNYNACYTAATLNNRSQLFALASVAPHLQFHLSRWIAPSMSLYFVH